MEKLVDRWRALYKLKFKKTCESERLPSLGQQNRQLLEFHDLFGQHGTR